MSNTKKGKFIVFEGLDGSGKGTQIKLTIDKLKEENLNVYSTAEPTFSATGGIIRDTLSGFSNRSSCELGALFLADRIFHNTNNINGIKKFIDSGVNVICDRYYYSSFAYQGLDTDLDWLIDMNLNCKEILKPDLCIYLDIEPDKCNERIKNNRFYTEIFEDYNIILKTRNRFFEVFKKLKDKENIVIIPADRDMEDINIDVLNEIKKIM